MSAQLPVRVFIGTEPRMWVAETVLRYSILAHASVPVEIVSMDYSRGGVWEGWSIGRPRGRPATVALNEAGNRVWFTEFTNYRWAIPEVCGFAGRAIYLDVDMVVLGDIAELWNTDLPAPVLSLAPNETSVMLFDCARFAGLEGWPAIAEMKTSGWGVREFVAVLQRQQAIGQLPVVWNCLDGQDFSYTRTRLVHYTNMSSQPWRPYPERLHYRCHVMPEMEELWFSYAERARDAGWFDNPPELAWPARPRSPAKSG